MDGLWATKSEDVGLIVRAISCFQDFQPMWLVMIHQRHRQTDGQTTCDRNSALCTIVHRAVKMEVHNLWPRGSARGGTTGRANVTDNMRRKFGGLDVSWFLRYARGQTGRQVTAVNAVQAQQLNAGCRSKTESEIGKNLVNRY